MLRKNLLCPTWWKNCSRTVHPCITGTPVLPVSVRPTLELSAEWLLVGKLTLPRDNLHSFTLRLRKKGFFSYLSNCSFNMPFQLPSSAPPQLSWKWGKRQAGTQRVLSMAPLSLLSLHPHSGWSHSLTNSTTISMLKAHRSSSQFPTCSLLLKLKFGLPLWHLHRYIHISLKLNMPKKQLLISLVHKAFSPFFVLIVVDSLPAALAHNLGIFNSASWQDYI